MNSKLKQICKTKSVTLAVRLHYICPDVEAVCSHADKVSLHASIYVLIVPELSWHSIPLSPNKRLALSALRRRSRLYNHNDYPNVFYSRKDLKSY